MTLPRKAPFLHLGGPADGAYVPVELDENGVPVELYTLRDYTAPDFAVNPAFGLASNLLYAMYERDERITGDGVEYVFAFRGQDVITDAAA